MKKILLFTALIISLNSIKTFAQEVSYQMYVHDVKTTELEYNVGDTIQGNFTISNLSEIGQSDLYYTISSGSYDAVNMSIATNYAVTDKIGPLYIKAKAKDVINFDYNLPKSLSGNAGIHITLMLKDGTLVGESQYSFLVKGSPSKKAVYVSDSYLTIDNFGQNIPLLTGPTIYEGEKANLVFSFFNTEKTFKAKPILKLYDRVDNAEALKKTIELDEVTISSGQNTIPLPTDIDSLVYYGVLTFDSKDVDVSPVYFRYIVAGPISTILNITSNDLEIKKGKDFNITVNYAGQPTDEFRPEKQLAQSDKIINITAYNEKKEVVAQFSKTIKADEENEIMNIPLNASFSAESLSFSANITDMNGKVLSNYETDLPKLSDLEGQQSYVNIDTLNLFKKYISWFYALVLIVLFAIGYYFVTRKFLRYKLLLAIIFTIALVATFIIIGKYYPVSAQSLPTSPSLNPPGTPLNIAPLSQEMYIASLNLQSDKRLNVNALISPLPPAIKSYAPGERFNLSFSATFKACNNDPFQYLAYAFDSSVEWWTKKPILESVFAKNLSYWQTNGTQMFNYRRNGLGWDQLFLTTDLKAIIPGLSPSNEAGMKELVRMNGFVIDTSNKLKREEKLTIKPYIYVVFQTTPQTALSGKWDVSRWINIEKNRANLISSHKIMRDAGLITGTLADFDFSNTEMIGWKTSTTTIAGRVVTNSVENDYTKIYRTNLIALYNVSIYNKEVALFLKHFSGGAHGYESVPTTLTRQYNAPTIPGFHDIYFYLSNQSGDGKNRNMLVKQTICVSGAGLCPTETEFKNLVVNVDNIKTTSADVNWIYDNTSKPQTDYIVEYSTNQAFPVSQYITINSSAEYNAITSKQRQLTGLTPNTNYYVRMKIKTVDGWSSYANTNFKTAVDTNTSCSCNGTRTETCTVPGGTPSISPNSANCKLSLSCLVTRDSSINNIQIIPQNNLANLVYNINGNTINKNIGEPMIYSLPFSSSTQNVTVNATDSKDGQTASVTCSVPDKAEAVVPVGPPTLTIGKSPSVTLNKGGSCTINWDIQNMPADARCTLSGLGLPKDIFGKSNETFNNISVNTKFSIKCLNPDSSPIVPEQSVICRVNPDVKEN